MSILTAHNLAQSFGHHDIFSGLSLKIEHGNKIGLVGPNGVGKTSLLRILTRLDQPTEGGLYAVGKIQIGYLHQEAVQTFANRDHTIREEMLTVFAHLVSMEKRMRTVENLMADGDLSEELFDEYSQLVEAFEQQGGYDYETQIAQTLQGLGFDQEDFDQPLVHLSGG